jgi:bifunctional UDP-N-acetylglucosamine pyrophosphorylase / glucosamine-1-phosphate N-acetyltransferase
VTDEAGDKVRQLLDQGVVVHAPATVHVDEDVDVGRIAPGAVIHAGCRIRGERTSIGPGSAIGSEAPATVDNCQLGRDVSLKGGYFSGSTFLDGSSVGSCAHVRPGTLLEEEASAAHSVGLKQTVLLPFVTGGSLINMCDCLVAGGTSRTNHSEIGSSYIHFNFTPNQDKATASLLGDVPRGVMLDQAPIFLGGQGGLVGPSRLAFGTIVAAGVICRQDIVEGNRLFVGRAGGSGGIRPYTNGVYTGIDRLLTNNLLYLGNIRALLAWYRVARKPIMTGSPCQEACWAGAVENLELILRARVRRMTEMVAIMDRALDQVGQRAGSTLSSEVAAEYGSLVAAWPRVEAPLRQDVGEAVGAAAREAFLAEWGRIVPLTPYPEAIALVSPQARIAGTAWLQAVVDAVVQTGRMAMGDGS